MSENLHTNTQYANYYQRYTRDSLERAKRNPLQSMYPALPNNCYEVIYADPPWDYGGGLQYDRSSIVGGDVRNNIFISSASFKYPTLTLDELKALSVREIAADDCLLFMWTTGPQMQHSIELGAAWGFAYKTIAFVWDKQIHNPGRYTLSQTEFVLAFKRGRFPQPRGARNVRQLVSVCRGEHSEKPIEVISGITDMFPEQRKIELFARRNYEGWDNWGLEIPDNKVAIASRRDARQPSLFSFGVTNE